MKDVMFYQFHYRLVNDAGDLVDTSEGGEPVAFLQGDNRIVPGLQEALKGKEAGENFSVTVPPEKAYGWPQRTLIRVLSPDLFDPGLDLTIGRLCQVGSGSDAQVVKVVAIEPDGVTVDGNHPLAGISLNFDIDVLDARPATVAERQAANSSDT